MIKYFLKVIGLSILLASCAYFILDKLQASHETPIFQQITLSYYLKPKIPFSWFMNYFPFIGMVSFILGNLVVFFMELILIEPSYTPRHDTSDLPHLIHQPIPPLDHLSDTLYTCPKLDIEAVETEIVSQGSSNP